MTIEGLTTVDTELEQSLVVWANTFGTSADSLEDFASGDLLIPVVRAILVLGQGSGDKVADADLVGTGWTSVFSLLESAELLGNWHVHELGDAHVDDVNGCQDRAMAVSCLKALLRYAVGEECLGRETIIRKIMSLDASAQGILSRIIVDECDSELGSPSRESAHGDSCDVSPTQSPLVSPRVRDASERRVSLGHSPSYALRLWSSPPEKSFKEMVASRRNSPPPPEGCSLQLDAEDISHQEMTPQDTRLGESCGSVVADQVRRRPLADRIMNMHIHAPSCFIGATLLL